MARSTLASAGKATAPLLAAILLTGCEGLATGLHNIGLPIADWQDVRPQPQVRVVSQSYPHTVAFAGNEVAPSPAERARLDAFLARLEVSSRDQVHVVVPPGGGLLGQQRIEAVGAVLARAGLRWTAMVDSTAGPLGSGAELGVVVERQVVALPPCPNWTEWPNQSFSNRPTSYWGCSTAVDLGMMVADPDDLVLGREPGPSDATVSARSIDRYRQGKTKPMIRDAGSSDVYPASSGGQ